MLPSESLEPERTQDRWPQPGACPLCSHASSIPEPELTSLLNLHRTGRKVVRCGACGFRFMDPFLSAVEIEALYNTESDYFDDYVNMPYEEIVREKKGHYAFVRTAVERRLGRRGRLLDLGCATGHFLQEFKTAGWDVLGVEISDWCREYARRNFGIATLKGTVETVELPDEKFDVIAVNHVLEHLTNPLQVLRKLRRPLKPDGLLCVEVPNEFNDLVFMLAPARGRRRLYNQRRPILHHQLFFRPRHLHAALRMAGWQVKHTRTSNWRFPVPSHLFASSVLNSAAKLVRKSVLMAGSLFEHGEFILCLATKNGAAAPQLARSPGEGRNS